MLWFFFRERNSPRLAVTREFSSIFCNTCFNFFKTTTVLKGKNKKDWQVNNNYTKLVWKTAPNNMSGQMVQITYIYPPHSFKQTIER